MNDHYLADIEPPDSNEQLSKQKIAHDHLLIEMITLVKFTSMCVKGSKALNDTMQHCGVTAIQNRP